MIAKGRDDVCRDPLTIRVETDAARPVLMFSELGPISESPFG
jgi:hypothetical protein